jgi:hypothetical protein
MKRFLALVVTAAAAVALYTTTAPAGQQAVTPRQFNALSKKVTQIRKDLDTTASVLVGCVMGTALPISQYNGYLYQTQAGQVGVTTALDLTVQGGTPGAYALLVSPDAACVNLINSATLRKLSASVPTLKRTSPTFGRPQNRR